MRILRVTPAIVHWGFIMGMKRSILVVILSAFCLLGMASCSSGPKPTTETKQVMPTEYPKEATQTLKALQPHIPADTQAILVASYGSLADTILQFQKWNLVDNKDLDSALKDLEMHYQLNPTKLSDYFKAGMNTASGFSVGYVDNNVYILFDIYDSKKFKSWLDNFMNEEFGRPRYHEQNIESKTLTEIHILDQDYATLVTEDGKPALLILGEGLVSGSASSIECAQKLAEVKAISQSAIDNIVNMISAAPIAAWASGQGKLADRIPEKYNTLKNMFSDIIFDINLAEDGPKMHMNGHLKPGQAEDALQGVSLAALSKGSNSGWGDALMHANPSSNMRALFDAQQLEELALPFLNEKTQNTYLDIKQKLTQKLLKIDISDQIIYNIGGIWASIYGARTTDSREPSLKDILFAQNAVIYLPLKDASKSDAFFAKLNILKRVIPEDKAQIDMEGDVLHAIVNLGGNQKLHAGYHDGLIAVTTDKGWAQAAQTLKTKDAPASDSLHARENHFLAAHISFEDLTKLLGMRYGIVKEQVSNFLSPMNYIDMQASVNETALDVTLQGVLNNE